MNYHQIRAFTLVAQEGSVRRASEILRVSQPTVSQHLKALEQQYGLRLLEKRGRGLVLTEAGKDLFSVTKKLMLAADHVEEMLLRPPKTRAGRLKIVSDSPTLAVQIVSALEKTNPELEISIRKDSVLGVIEALKDMRADVGIAVEPMIGSELLVQPIKREELFAALPLHSSLAGMSEFAIQQAGGQSLIMREKTSRTRALVERALSMENVSPGRIIEVEGPEVVREAVAAGLGLAFFAESECPPDHRIVYRRVVVKNGRIGFVENVIIRQDRKREPEIAQFLDAARATGAQPKIPVRATANSLTCH